MKTNILSILLFISASYFAQIPNSGFENWTSMTGYEVPNGWGTMNHATATGSVYTATKASPGNPGSFYMKLTSRTIGSVVVNGIAVSGQLDSVTMQPKSGFAYTQRPANFTGRWQHMIYGSSQGSLMASLTRWDSGLNQRVAVATASVTLSGMAMSWANFTIPFVYSDGGYPDTCIIVLKASGSNPTNNDYLWVDNLAFVGTVAGTIEQDGLLSMLSVFPNPANDKLWLNVSVKYPSETSVNITDVTGRTIISKDLGLIYGEKSEFVNISEIPAGIYFVRVSSGARSEVKKVIIN
jgi:hypothetical protein